jgi:PAS domain S-box-containing protein
VPVKTFSPVATAVPFHTFTPAEHPRKRPGPAALFVEYEKRVIAQTNQLFWWLLIVQWAFAVLVAAVWSPRAWEGTHSSLHPHLIAAVAFGAILVIPPLALVRWQPQLWLTRHAIALAQISFSGLLIHLTGGRIETHFHVFGSLAFLALYRDWRVLITATLVVALDHLVRGMWYPVSVYGVPYATIWRTVEHAAWVIFEDVVLIWACFVSRREMWEICRREDLNQELLARLEDKVTERTAALESEVRQHERTAVELRSSQARYRMLVDNAPIGIFETTRAGEVHFANPHLLRVLGLPPDTSLEQLDLSDGKILSPVERERFWVRLQAESEVSGFQTTCTRPDGTVIHVVLNGHLLAARPGETPVCEGTLEDITPQKNAQRDLETVHQQLVVASRQAGMADVATGVLHNIGNVLTSVNITIHDLLERLRGSRIGMLHRVAELIQKERPRLATFLTEDPTGQRLPDFIAKLDVALQEENARYRHDVEGLVGHFAHIREVIATQQSTARLFGVSEKLAPTQLFEDALKLTADSFDRHGIELVREFTEVSPVRADRHKVLQILVNLLKNSKDALMQAGITAPRIAVRIAAAPGGHIALTVEDNGVGIAPEHLQRIFSHGFTTKKDGHGFGLHSCVLAAREMKGDVIVASEGVGRGAAFTLTLPMAA